MQSPDDDRSDPVEEDAFVAVHYMSPTLSGMLTDEDFDQFSLLENERRLDSDSDSDSLDYSMFLLTRTPPVIPPHWPTYDSDSADEDPGPQPGPSRPSTASPEPVEASIRLPAEPSSRGPDELRVPLEVLERILQYAIMPQSELTPSSDPPRRRRAFLLISRAVYKLALPLLYHTIWITRPSQYVDLFDPVSGVFIAGEDGPARWRHVRQLAIRPPAVPPSSQAVAPAPVGKLLPLQVPTGHTLERVCFLEPNEICEDQKTIAARRPTQEVEAPNPAAMERLAERMRQNPDFYRTMSRSRPRAALTPPPPVASREVHIERRWFLSQLLGHIRPRELHLSSGALMCQDFASPGRVFNGAQVTVYASDFSSNQDAFYRAFVVQQTLGAGPLRMVGFNKSAIGAFDLWVNNGRPIPNGPGKEADVKRAKKWVFEDEDGSRISPQTTS